MLKPSNTSSALKQRASTRPGQWPSKSPTKCPSKCPSKCLGQYSSKWLNWAAAIFVSMISLSLSISSAYAMPTLTPPRATQPINQKNIVLPNNLSQTPMKARTKNKPTLQTDKNTPSAIKSTHPSSLQPIKLYQPKLPPLSTSSHQLTNINLMRAYQLAQKFDPTYLQNIANNQATTREVAITRADLLPQLSASAGIGQNYDLQEHGERSYNDSIGLNVNQLIFDFSKIKNLSAAQLDKQAALLDSGAQLQDLMQRLTSRYFTVSLDQKQIQLDKLELENDQRLLKEVQAEYAAGKVYRVDVDNALGNVATTRAKLLSDQTTLITDRNNLAMMIGIPLVHVNGLKQTPRFKLVSRKLKFWTQATLQHNLSILSTRLQQRATQQMMRGSYSNFMPSVSAQASYNIGRSADEDDEEADISNHTASLGLSVNWKLFASGKSYNLLQQNKDKYLAAQQATRYSEQKFIGQCRSAFNRTMNDELQIELNTRAAKLKWQSFQHTLATYREGVPQYTLDNVIQNEEAYYTAENTLLTSQYDYLNAIIELREAAGSLSPETLQQINQWLH